MIRRQVENLRGLVLTPEELDFIRPIVAKSLEMNKHYETKESPAAGITQVTLMNGAGDTLELEGTEKQIEAFEEERKEMNEILFPYHMSYIRVTELALKHGLTVKKVTTRK